MKGHKPLRMGTISDLSHIIVGWGKDRGTLSVRGDGGGGGTAAGGFPGIATWACLALTLHHYTRSSHQLISPLLFMRWDRGKAETWISCGDLHDHLAPFQKEAIIIYFSMMWKYCGSSIHRPNSLVSGHSVMLLQVD